MREEKSYVSMYAWLSRIFNNFFGGDTDTEHLHTRAFLTYINILLQDAEEGKRS